MENCTFSMQVSASPINTALSNNKVNCNQNLLQRVQTLGLPLCSKTDPVVTGQNLHMEFSLVMGTENSVIKRTHLCRYGLEFQFVFLVFINYKIVVTIIKLKFHFHTNILSYESWEIRGFGFFLMWKSLQVYYMPHSSPAGTSRNIYRSPDVHE